MNYVQWHIGDWLSGTSLLSATERGVYIDLLMRYYREERPLMQSECKRIARAYDVHEQEALTYVLETFFELENGSYRHKRCEEEIASMRVKSEKRSNAAKIRWAKSGKGYDGKHAEYACASGCASACANESAKDVQKASGEALSLHDFEDCYCVGGIDLSRTTDLTACTIVIEKNEKLYVFCKFFLPAERIEEATARDGLPYNAYIKRGILIPSGDNFVDYHDCFAWFRQLVEEYRIYPLKIGYDRYTAQYLVQDMAQYGFHMDDVFQGYNLTPVIRETEGLMRDGVFCIGDNDLLKVHLLDTALKTDAESGKSKPVKISANAHIDGAAALLDAMCVSQKYCAEIGEQLRNEG